MDRIVDTKLITSLLVLLVSCYANLIACPHRLWIVNKASEDIRACVEMRDCTPTSKYNIMMNSLRLFPYAHLDLHPIFLTFESSRMGSCSYDLECRGETLLLKRKDVVVDSIDIAMDETDFTIIVNDDCQVSFSQGTAVIDYQEIE